MPAYQNDSAFDFDDAGGLGDAGPGAGFASPSADVFELTDPSPFPEPDLGAALDRVAASRAAPAEASAARAISGTRFADDIRGTLRDDDIFAFGGQDLVRGRDGDDLIDGGKGADGLYGGDGRDALWGGRGVDSLYGGRGADNFWFDEDRGYDRVLDFRAGDTLVVDGETGDFDGARWRDIELDGGRRFDELYVFGDLVARIYGEVVIRDDILLLT